MSEAFIRSGKFFDLIHMPDIPHAAQRLSLQYWYDAEARYLVEHLVGVKAFGRGNMSDPVLKIIECVRKAGATRDISTIPRLFQQAGGIPQ